MQAIAYIGWLCQRCGLVMQTGNVESTREYREIKCVNEHCANHGIRYKEPQIVADLEPIEQAPKLAVASG